MTKLLKVLGRWYNFLRHPDRFAIVGWRLLPLVSGGLPETIDNQSARQSSLDRLAVMNDSVSAHNLFMGFQNADTATTVGAAGAATALPTNPVGYVFISSGGTVYKIPFYNP